MEYVKACQFFLQYGNIDLPTYEAAIHKPIKKFTDEQLDWACKVAVGNGQTKPLVGEAKRAIIDYNG